MRPFALLLLLAAFPALGDEVLDRAAIASAFRSLAAAKSLEAMTALFTADADREEIARLYQSHALLVHEARQPWSERALPSIALVEVRFLTPSLARAIAAQTQVGSTIYTAIPLEFFLRREAGRWRFAGVRLLPPGPPLRPPR